MGAKNLELVQNFSVGLCFFLWLPTEISNFYGSKNPGNGPDFFCRSVLFLRLPTEMRVIFLGAKNPEMVHIFSVGLCFFCGHLRKRGHFYGSKKNGNGSDFFCRYVLFLWPPTEMRSFVMGGKTEEWSRIFL